LARLTSRLSAALFALQAALLLAGPTAAEPLQRLHVRTFALSSDSQAVQLGGTVRITILLRADEQVNSCDNVTLPDFFGFKILGDERSVSSAPGGTTCTETLTVQATEPGTHLIGPVTLEAFDAATKRPTRFGSNSIAIRVGGALPIGDGGTLVRKGLGTLGWLALLTVALLLFVRVARPKVGTVTRIEPEPRVPAPSSPAPSERERWRALGEALAAHPSRDNVVAVRSVLRAQIGAREDETFGDVMARAAGQMGPELLEVMRTVERAAFIDNANLNLAVRDASAALRRYSESLPE
jgi:hypothetical protein